MEGKTLNLFYQSSIGHHAQHIIAKKIYRMVTNYRSPTILGVGYTSPYLEHFLSGTQSVISLTLPYIGIERWPRQSANRCILADEDHFPLQNNSIDIAILIHALEFAESPWAMMAEVNRILPVGGCIIAVVPNRVGLWARKGSLPFGHGRPFTKGQLNTLMLSAGFTPIKHEFSLFAPPFTFCMKSKISVFCERWGRWFFMENSGVIISLFEKQDKQRVLEKRRNFRSLSVIKTPVGVTSQGKYP